MAYRRKTYRKMRRGKRKYSARRSRSSRPMRIGYRF